MRPAVTHADRRRGWHPPGPDATRLVKTVHELRDAPLTDLTIEDLRILMSQRVGVDILTPVVLDILDADPLAGGDFYTIWSSIDAWCSA